MPRFLHVQKLVNRRVGYKESGKMTLGGDDTFAMNVERVLLRVQALVDTRESTQVRNHMSVKNVGRPSFTAQT